MDPGEIIVKAKLADCDWNAPFCYFPSVSSPVRLEALVTWKDGTTIPGATIQVSPGVTGLVANPSTGLTDSTGRFSAQLTGASAYVPYYTPQVLAWIQGFSRQGFTRVAAISDDICDADSTKVYDAPTYVSQGTPGYISYGACGEVGKTCVDGSGFVDGTNGACGETVRSEAAQQTGYWYDKVLVIPQDLRFLGSIYTLDVALQSQQGIQGSGTVTLDGGNHDQDSIQFYFNSPGIGSPVTLSSYYEAWLWVYVPMTQIYDPDTLKCIGSTGGSSSASLSAVRTWTLGDVYAIDRATGEVSPVPHWVFSCSGKFTTPR